MHAPGVGRLHQQRGRITIRYKRRDSQYGNYARNMVYRERVTFAPLAVAWVAHGSMR